MRMLNDSALDSTKSKQADVRGLAPQLAVIQLMVMLWSERVFQRCLLSNEDDHARGVLLFFLYAASLAFHQHSSG